MTAAELFEMSPDTAGVDRWLFSGELVERWNGNGFHTPGHSAVVVAASMILSNWCRAVGGYQVYGYGCPFRLGRGPDTVVSYDASVCKRLAQSAGQDGTHLEGAPLLAVEVMELDEDEDLLGRLVAESLRGGVWSMWVINPFEELVVHYRSGEQPLYVNGRMELTANPVLPGFKCRVAEIFG